MPERNGEARLMEAILYVTDALSPEESADYEIRLGEDHAAREVLARVVALSHECTGSPAPVPDASYRAAVRECVLPTPSWRLVLRRAKPLGWALAGATAACAAMFTFYVPGNSEQVVQQPIVIVDGGGASSEPDTEFVPPPMPSSAVRFWATLSRGQHLQKVHDEEQRRRSREETHIRLFKKDEKVQ